MMQINCPFCGGRDETEFSYGGEAHIARPAMNVTDSQWADYLFFRNNVKGVHAERWRHTRGCGQWFNALRNTATHRFLAIYRITEPRPELPAEPAGGSITAPGAASVAARPHAASAAHASHGVTTPVATPVADPVAAKGPR